MWAAAIALKLYLTYRVTLATFLAAPCYDVVNGRAVGAPHACDESPGSFNHAMRAADACGGDWAGTSGHYFAACPTR